MTCPRLHTDLDSGPFLSDSGAQLFIILLCCPLVPLEQNVTWQEDKLRPVSELKKPHAASKRKTDGGCLVACQLSMNY